MLLLLALATAPRLAPGVIPFEREGVMSWNVGPPTAFWWPKTGSMMVYEAARYGNRDNEEPSPTGGAAGTYWPPSADGSLQPPTNHSYFRIRAMATGTVVGTVQGSECFAYGSAVVDPSSGRAWVFGSERDLCGGQHKDDNPSCAPFWQGRPKAGNGVRAWWSDDLETWHTAEQPALMFPAYLCRSTVLVYIQAIPSSICCCFWSMDDVHIPRSRYPFNTDVTPVVNKTLLTRSDGSRAIVDSTARR